jgi:membrane protease YdiL (CAAX protease family)
VTSVPPPSEPPARPDVSYRYLPPVAPGSAPAEPPVPPDPPAGRWLALPLWVPFATMLAAVIAILIFGAIATGIYVLIEPDADTSTTPDGLLIGLTVVQDALLVGAAVFAVAAILGRATPAMFGLRRVKLGPAVGWILVAYGGYWLASVILLAIFGEPPEQDLVRDLKETQDTAVLIGFGVLTCLVAPIAEEFFFRGFLFSVLASRLGVAVAAVLTGAIFGLIHLPGSPLLGVAVLVAFGALLCVVYWKTGSLIPCMALHALNNAVSFGYTKSLGAVGIIALIAGSVALVTLIGLALAGRGDQDAAVSSTNSSSTPDIPPAV